MRRGGAVATGLVLVCAGCRAAAPRPQGTLTYVGSSTVASYLSDAESVYGAVRFELDTAPESDGGEAAILDGRTQLAGIARAPRTSTLQAGVAATLLGRDAIAVVVDARNPVSNLTLDQLRAVFTGEIESWSELGGPDLPVRPFIVGRASATRAVFRAAVLDGVDYAGCTEVGRDADLPAIVADTPGGIGTISFGFLNGGGVRAVAIDGTRPSVTDFDYPISRPLYLLWREGDPVLEAFVDWTQSPEGQRVLMQRFVGRGVVGSVRGEPSAQPSGTLVVYTETQPHYDGGIYYYPHRPYEVLSRTGTRIRRVENHRGLNDEAPERVRLPPGTYLVRAETARGAAAEFFVTIESGERTELDVVGLIEERR